MQKYDRSNARVTLSAIWILLLAFTALPFPATAADRTVETPAATLHLSAGSCDLIGVSWKSPAMEIIREPKLGENFRLLLPLPDYQANYFNSRDQQVTRIDSTNDSVTCYYQSLKNARETVPVEVYYKIQASGGQLLFSIEIQNRTDRKLAEVYYGILGGLQGIGDRTDTQSMVPGATENLMPQLFTNFRESPLGGTRFGARYEVSGFTYPGVMPMGWVDVYNLKTGTGFYYGNQDPDTRLSALYFEMRPYVKATVNGGNWPSAQELPPGEPIGVTMGWLDFPYISNGRFVAGPVALQAHRGDWHSASAIYRSWFDRHFDVRRTPTWLRKENAWQSIIISSPEDVVVHKFSDLPQLAADAKKYGITTFEILGWNIGGIDHGYPQYQPDPRLGTEEEFRKALAEIRAMGVHPLIFSNVQMVDTALPLFRDKFEKYAVDGLWAPDWSKSGFGEGTMGARLGLTQSNMTMVSPQHPEFRNYLMGQYLDLVRDGADGFQLDKTHPAALDFNSLLPVSPDKSLNPGIIDVFRELLQKAHELNPSFALAAEDWTDRAFPYVDVSYMRMGNIDMGSTALRYTFPEWTSTIFAEGPGDFNALNNGMRYGLVWDVAARHYNDSVDEELTRPLARYLKEMIRIRRQYQDLLFLGRFNDTMGASVSAGADVRYSVFNSLSPGNGDRATVLINFDNKPEDATLSISGRGGQMVEVSSPFEMDRRAKLPVTLTIPPNRCVVVVSREASGNY